MGRKRTYTDDQFCDAVRTSLSIAQVMNKLGLKPTGGNYTHFKFTANRLGVNFSHFTGQAHLRGKHHNWSPKIPLDEIMVENSTYSNRGDLKRRMLEVGLLTYECAICNLVEWRGQSLSLHLDHINGHPTDHRCDNLRLLCPNCHAQTDTYCGKNKKRSIKTSRCLNCHSSISRNAKHCKSCAGKIREQPKIGWPSADELSKMVQSTNYSATARILGVSDNAIRKRLRRYGS